MHHPKGFPSRLVRLRADAGMTQRDLAQASGVSVPQIARYETGTSKPRMTALVKLAKALGVDVSMLADANEEPETVELALYIQGEEKPLPVALRKERFDQIAAEAKASGVTLEAQIMALLEYGLRVREGQAENFEDVLCETQAKLDKLPPLPEG